jgi:hypothetical protein
VHCDTLEELETFAAPDRPTIDPDTTGRELGRQMIDCSRGFALQASSATTTWPTGMRNMYFKPGGCVYAASLPVVPGSGSVRSKGLSWSPSRRRWHWHGAPLRVLYVAIPSERSQRQRCEPHGTASPHGGMLSRGLGRPDRDDRSDDAL